MVDVTPDAAVVARVKTLSAADRRPALTEEEVLGELQARPLPDVDGLYTGQTGWTPTWDIMAAVAALWGIKAGKVAGDFNFTADSAQYGKGDVMAHCLAMEQKYASMAAGSAPTSAVPLADLGGLVING